MWKGHLASVAAVTILGGVAIDYSSEFAQRLLRGVMSQIARAYLEGSTPPVIPPASQDRSAMPDDEPGGM